MPSSQKVLPLIYIVGNSHCGSTLLGFLLSANPDIIFLGELKSRTWLKDRYCSCGSEAEQCPFYGPFFQDFNVTKKQLFEGIKPKKSPGIFELKKRFPTKTTTAINHFYQMINQRVRSLYPDATHITDGSKSVWMLRAWLQADTGKEIKIIWLRRSIPANVSSFMKRGNKFWKSYLAIRVNDWLIRNFLKSNAQPHLIVDFEKLHEDYANVMKSISDFIGITIPVKYHNQHNHHVISGNRFTRTAFMDGDTGLKEDDQWKTILTSGQKKILSWIK